MKRIVISIFLVLAAASNAVMASDAHAPTSPIPATFFGMHRHLWPQKGEEPWPDIPFGSFRMWDSNTGWAQINVAPGKYDWSTVDKWFSELKQHDVEDVIYTFGRTPRFASSQPGMQCNYGPGQCAPSK